ncbi:hypothetical protein SAMN04488107_3251 [Geodermatophilus saharensis]|uniref:Uncharacterized protein n=1 Tax=Geodermatophilus saharensis TaxID=1137994 RepID=A0A239G1S3_9ACTN|nr:hypothetical protein [Geodermatophilus saharensis]SNS63217.1 hypothetical protein SAMN04488107_3251 [Geodermatophilus saharensis]
MTGRPGHPVPFPPAAPPLPPSAAPRRPGTLVTACVLACLLAAASVPGAGATWWFAGASDLYGELGSPVPRQGLVLALLELAAAGALVTGVVLLAAGIDRRTLVVTCAVELGVVGWWLYQVGAGPFGVYETDRLVFGGTALAFGAVAVTTAALALSPPSGRWLAVRRALRGR